MSLLSCSLFANTMPSIDILHPNTKSPEQTRVALEEVAAKLASRFGVSHHWEGDELAFNGGGVDGRIAMLPDALHVTAELGFLLSAMKTPIEAEIRRVLDERFA